MYLSYVVMGHVANYVHVGETTTTTTHHYHHLPPPTTTTQQLVAIVAIVADRTGRETGEPLPNLPR